MPIWWLTNDVLEQKKMSLVSQYNCVLDRISSYNVPDSYESQPLQDLKNRRDCLREEIWKINELLYHNDWDDRYY